MSTPEIPTSYPQPLPVLSREAQASYRDEQTGVPLLALVELGEAVLDEHRSALLAEQDLTDPERQADARANAEHARKLLQDLL